MTTETPAAKVAPGLNARQREAVEHTDGPLQVIAGPGTGKTRVITEKVLHLVRGGTPPDRILALTFTEKAAGEMSGRIRASLAKEGIRGQPKVSTFHGFCLEVVKEHADLLGYDAEPRLLVGPLYVQFVVDHVDELATDNTDLVGKVTAFASTLAEFASLTHDESLSTRDLVAEAKTWLAGLDAKERASAEKVLDLCASLPKLLLIQRRANVVTYGDLLTDANRLLRDFPEARARLAARWTHLLVDELQDNNRAQADLVDLLTDEHGQVTVVGDEDQSIYRFRGARMELLGEFRSRWEGRPAGKLAVVPLEENYRSTDAIIAAGQALIRHNRQRFSEKVLRRANTSDAAGADRVRLGVAETDDGERRWLAHEVLDRIARGRAPGEIAILCRSLGHVDRLVDDLRRAGVAVEVVGGGGLFANPVVRELTAWLKALDDPTADEPALHRVLSFSGFGLDHADRRVLARAAAAERLPLVTILERAASDPEAVTGLSRHACERVRGFLEILARFREDAQPQTRADVAGILEDILRLTGLQRRLRPDTTRGRQNLAAYGGLLTVVHNYVENYPHPSLHGFVRHLDLLEELGHDDTLGEPSDDATTVKVMTVHQSKGREFPVVLVVGVNYRFPMKEQGKVHRKFLDSLTVTGDLEALRIEEERRVLYVAMTRAKEDLLLSACNVRNGKPVASSEYVDEIAACDKVTRIEVADADIPELPASPVPLRTRAVAEARLHFLVSRLGTHVDGADAKESIAEVLRLVAGLVADGNAGGIGAAQSALAALGLPADVETTWLAREPPGGFVGPLRLSASSLNKYEKCPRLFYYSQISGIPEGRAGDAADRGTMLHKVLEDFHRRHPAPTMDALPDLLALFELATEGIEFAAAAEKAQWLASKTEILRQYLREEVARGGRAVHMEHKFTLALGEDVTVTGKIDRVDELADGRLRVVDYKTGTVQSAPKFRDEDFQMPIYAWAVHEDLGKSLKEVVVVGLKELKHLRSGPTIHRVVLPWNDGSTNALTPEGLAAVRARVGAIVDGIRVGRFDPAPSEKNCGGCSYRLLCEAAWGVHGEEHGTVVVAPRAPPGSGGAR